MTLEEEIKHCEEVAEEREQAAREWHDCCGFPPIGDTQEEEDKCRESARECKQLAEWLKDYKRLLEQESKTGQFAKWVATEIFDDMWEYNKDAFAEIACRKLAKLGIVRAKGNEWKLVEPQESEK